MAAFVFLTSSISVLAECDESANEIKSEV